MAPVSYHHITNALVTSSQLLIFQQQHTPNSISIHFAQALLTQAAGVLLRLPQEVIARSLVLLQRHLVSAANSPSTVQGSKQDGHEPMTISAATLYLTAKVSFKPLSPRSVINVYAYLTSGASPLWITNPDPPASADANDATPPDPKTYYVSEGDYERHRIQLFAAETYVLWTLGFDIDVSLPHPLALTYLQALGVSSMSTTESSKLAHRVCEHLNGGLLSPQLLYLTHQPNALATAAIYLAAREVGVVLPSVNWWEVFDVDRESLGFLVFALGSSGNFAQAERDKWQGKSVL